MTLSEENELFYEGVLYEDEEEIMELNNTITCLKIDMENLNDKYIREKIAKEEVEELLENSVPKEVIREKIKELDKDIFYTKNILKGEYCDYIRKARLKAFVTKIKEFKNYLEELLER